MARRRLRRRSSGNKGILTKGLGQLIGLLIALYVFDQIVDALYTADSPLNASTYFGDAVDLVDAMLPIVGIIAGFYIIIRTIKQAGLM